MGPVGLELLAVWSLCAILGAGIGYANGRPVLGLVLGAGLGFVGLLVLACLGSPRLAQDTTGSRPRLVGDRARLVDVTALRPCRRCRGVTPASTNRCWTCGAILAADSTASPTPLRRVRRV